MLILSFHPSYTLTTTCLVVAVYATFPFIYKRGKMYKYFPANKKTNQSPLAYYLMREYLIADFY